jgi:NAD+ diphosphatase
MRALDAPETLLVPVYRDKNFVLPGGPSRAALPTAGEAGPLIDAASEIVWLGLVGGADCFALDVSNLSDPLLHPTLAGKAELADLRLAAGTLPEAEVEILAYARGMLYWHQRHRHCGSCGAPTKAKEGGHVRECEAEDLKHFPRTDPAVMVLVARGDRCVLARQPGWPQGMQSIVAGFVEPGESVEDCVVREVREELGLSVSGLRYFKSQPWPFPASLMIGFFAEAADEDIVVDRTELEAARWYSRAEIANPEGFWIPPPYSLANRMIAAWLSSGAGL